MAEQKLQLTDTVATIVTKFNQLSDDLGDISAHQLYDSSALGIMRRLDANVTANARSAISVTDAGGLGSLSYNNSTGVLTYTGEDMVNDTTPQLGGDLDTNSKRIKLGDHTVNADLSLGNKIVLGADSDLKIYHTGSHSVIYDAGTGSLQLRTNSLAVQNAAGTESQLTALSGGAVTLYHNNVTKLATSTEGVTISGTLNADSVALADGKKIRLGAAPDLEIYHTSGTGSFIDEIADGDLFLRSNTIHLKKQAADETMIKAVADGAVELYYDNVKRIETLTAGAEVTGDLKVSVSLGIGTAASTTGGEIRATNNITAYYSDERLKDIEGTIPNALDKVESINGYYYKENKLAEDFGYKNKKRQVGVSAQEIEAILPEAVTLAPFDINVLQESKSGENYKTVYYEKLVPLLIEAIKELNEKVKDLEAR